MRRIKELNRVGRAGKAGRAGEIGDPRELRELEELEEPCPQSVLLPIFLNQEMFAMLDWFHTQSTDTES